MKLNFKEIWTFVKRAFLFYILFSFVYHFSNEYKMIGVNIIDTVLTCIAVSLVACIIFVVVKNKVVKK